MAPLAAPSQRPDALGAGYTGRGERKGPPKRGDKTESETCRARLSLSPPPCATQVAPSSPLVLGSNRRGPQTWPPDTASSMASDPWRREEGKVLDSRRPMAGAGGPLRLRDWLVAQIESGRYAGLRWEDAAKTLFRIPWKHAAKQGYQAQQDAALFRVRGRRPAAGHRSGPAREGSRCVRPLTSVVSRLRVMFSVYGRPSDTLLKQNRRGYMTCTVSTSRGAFLPSPRRD